MTDKCIRLETILRRSPVIPVLVIDRLEDAVPLGRALVSGGLPVLEVTLRTPVALQAIAELNMALPDAVIGAGTVTTPDQLDAVAQAGAAFAVAPGLTDALTRAAVCSPLPFLPGAATVSEVMAAGEAGFQYLKFFPAELAGGIKLLTAFHDLFPHLRFCPTGGIRPNNAAEYLALDNVICIGGTWLAPAHLVQAGHWAEIENLAHQAVKLHGTA